MVRLHAHLGYYKSLSVYKYPLERATHPNFTIKYNYPDFYRMSSQPADQLFVVGIGASAGGLQALEEFFTYLPENLNAAFVVVQHLSPNHPSLMSELLQRQTKMLVQSIQNGLVLEPHTVYVLPPGKNLSLENQTLKLSEKPGGLSYPINEFFQSIATNYSAEHTIGILLSGTGNDGTQGLQAMSRLGELP